MPLASFLFDGWPQVGLVAVRGVLAYVALVLVLRLSGKRTLAKFNAFDLVVTVALGSMLATTILSTDVAVAEGVAGVALLIGAQYLITSGTVRWAWLRKAVKAQPRLLFYRGAFLRDALVAERVSSEEVRAAARESGHAQMDRVAAVVLETDGTFSVIGDLDDGAASALADVRGTEAEGLETGPRFGPAAGWAAAHRPARPDA